MSLEDNLESLKDALAEALPLRHVTRSLPKDPVGDIPREELLRGVICIVSEGGGEFANYFGREAELGHQDVTLAAFLQVDEHSQSFAIEQAELQLLQELLTWCGTGPFGTASDVTAKDWRQSKQLEHPYGWLLLQLDVRF